MPNESSRLHCAVFPTTRWTLIRATQGKVSGEVRQRALEELCEIYWPVLYGYARLKSYSQHDAEDLTQDFLSNLLRRQSLDTVQPAESKLRSFFLTAFQNHMTSEWRKSQAAKRGGDLSRITLNFDEAEKMFELYAPEEMSPERQFERNWAVKLLDQTLHRLRETYSRRGQAHVFDVLRPFLEPANDSSYDTAAEMLNCSAGTVRVYVHRLRQAYRETIRSELAETVGPEADPEEELRYLLATFSN